MTLGTHEVHWLNVAFDWDDEKNRQIRERRGITFPDVVTAVREGHLIDVRDHPDPDKEPGLHLLLAWIYDYVWVVPCSIDPSAPAVLLKTAWPSRKFTRELRR